MRTLASVETMWEIRARLRTVRVDDHPRWGRMTAKQMVRHLACAYDIALGDMVVEPVKGLPPVLMKGLGLWTGLRWPKNVQTVPELKRAIAKHDDESLDELVAVTVGRMEMLAGGARFAPTHAMFGPMSEKDWLRWGYLHADHHLRQFGR